MSLPREYSRRAILRGVSLAALALPLFTLPAGCNFQPLYKPRSSSGGAAPQVEMGEISIRPIQGRTGQEMHNLLLDRLNPSGQPNQPKYKLLVSLTQRNQDQGIQEDETASRVDVTVAAKYQLIAYDDNQVLLRGRAQSVNSYDILDISVYYSTTTSEQDAVRRSLTQLADDIQLRLAVFFADPANADDAKANAS